MRMHMVPACLIVHMLAVSGCATVAHKRVQQLPIPLDGTPEEIKSAREQNRAIDQKTDGIRYYELAPYLLLKPNGKGVLEPEIAFLPDQSRKMTAQPKAIFAKIDTDMTFDNGTLQKAIDSGDATALRTAFSDLFKTQAPRLARLGAARATSSTEQVVPAPYLFKIILAQGSIDLVGGQGTENIHVQLLGN